MGSEGRRGQRSRSPAPSILKWTPRMDEAYEAAVEKLGGLDQCKPKAMLLQLQSDQPELFAELDVQRVKWKLLSHRRREQRHRAMAPQGIAPPTKWSGRLEEAYEDAVAQLGGIHSAQPKQVLERLQPEFPDLTLEIIKWHLQGQRRRERRLAGRSGSTKPPLQRGQEQQEGEGESEEEEEQEERQQQQQQARPMQQQQQQQQQEWQEQQQQQQQEWQEQQQQQQQEWQEQQQQPRPMQQQQEEQQRRPTKQPRAAKLQRQRPPRGRQRVASATPASAAPTAEGTAMSVAEASDDEAEVAPVKSEQQLQQGQAPAGAAPQQQQLAQQALEQQAIQQQLLQQALMAQQLGQLPGAAATPFLPQQHQQLPHLPALLAGHPAAAAAFLGPPGPSGLAAGAAPTGLPQLPAAVAAPSWAQHTLLAAFCALNKARRDRLVASQVVHLLEEQRDKLQQLVPILVAAEAAQAPNSSASGDPLSQLLHSAQLLPLGQEWPSLASGSALLAPTAIRDVSPAALKRQPRAVLAAAAAFPLRSPSPAVGPLQSGGGGGSMSSGESGEGHLLACTIPNCRRCAYERRLQGAKQQQTAAAAAGGGQPPPEAQQQQQQQQQVVPASLAEEALLDFTDPALVKLLGSLLGSMPTKQAASGGPAS